MEQVRIIAQNASPRPASWARLQGRGLYLADLLRELVGREMKVLYKRSVLGIGWALVLPFLQLIIFSFVFRVVLGVEVKHYASFAFTGLLVWTWFMTSLVQSNAVITGNRPLLRQPGFPVAVLPIASVTTRLIHMIIALPVLLPFLIAQDVALTLNLLFLPLLVLLQFLFTMSLAYPLAALNVTLRDTQHVLAVLLQLLMYVTPIFYSLENVPDSYRPYYLINPMVYLIEGYRDILIRGMAPDWRHLGGLTALAALLLPAGLWMFRRQKERFAEEL